MQSLSPPPPARPYEQLRASKIREVANAGIGREDIAAFWFGEPDEVTPEFIRQAAIDALNAGDTFYTHNLGIPELREAIAAYVTRLHRPTAVGQHRGHQLRHVGADDRRAGDRRTPATAWWRSRRCGRIWWRFPKILGAQVRPSRCSFTPAGWKLDVERLLERCTPGTRAVFINSPNNPTGWTIDRDSAARDPRALPPARHLDRRRRRLRAAVLHGHAPGGAHRAGRAFVPRHRRRRKTA